MRAWLFSTIFALSVAGCPARLTAPPRPVVAAAPSSSLSGAAPKRDLGPLVPIGFAADRVGPRNAPVGPDGETDFGFRVRVSGDVLALLVGVSDGNGESSPAGLWDTLIGPEPIPKAWGLKHTEAAITWAVAVVGADGKVLNPLGPLERKRFADETLEIFAADPGHHRFVSGRTYTLYVPRPDGTIDRATATIL